jgi:hypothetical protein
MLHSLLKQCLVCLKISKIIRRALFNKALFTTLSNLWTKNLPLP